MAIDRSLVSGSMGMMILRLLTEKDMYGYYARLKSSTKDYQFEDINLNQCLGEVLEDYAPLLEEKQFVTSYEQEVLGKVRKYYQITGEGKKHLEQKKSEWKEYSKAVSNVLALEV